MATLARRPRLRLAWLAGIGYAIVLVIDGQGGAASQADVADRLVPDRQPKSLDLLGFVVNLAFLDPERRVLRGLSLNVGDGEVGGVDPHLAAIEVFAARLRADPQHILPTRFRRLVSHKFKVVIVAI